MSVDPQLRTLEIDIPSKPDSLVKLSLLLADDDVSALLDKKLGALAHLVGDVLVAVVAHDGEATQTLAILHLEAAGGLYARSGFVAIDPYNDNPNATRWYGKTL